MTNHDPSCECDQCAAHEPIDHALAAAVLTRLTGAWTTLSALRASFPNGSGARGIAPTVRRLARRGLAEVRGGFERRGRPDPMGSEWAGTFECRKAGEETACGS